VNTTTSEVDEQHEANGCRQDTAHVDGLTAQSVTAPVSLLEEACRAGTNREQNKHKTIQALFTTD